MSTLHELHRPLGSTGFQVSPLGLGTVKLGRDQGVKYPNGFTIPDDAQALALLQQARELGINLIDTAPAYGIGEQRLGPLLRGQRDEWVIVSKTGEEFEQGRSHFDFSPRILASRSSAASSAWRPIVSICCWCTPTATILPCCVKQGVRDAGRAQA